MCNTCIHQTSSIHRGFLRSSFLCLSTQRSINKQDTATDLLLNSPRRRHTYFRHSSARLDINPEQYSNRRNSTCTQNINFSFKHEMSATSMTIPILLLGTMTLASTTSSNSYGPAYETPSIPILTVAILGPPFVNSPSITVTSTSCTTESLSALPISTDTTAATENWTSTSTSTSTGTLDSMEVTSSMSTAYAGFEAPTATFLTGETPTLTMQLIAPGCAALCQDAYESGECDQTVVCANGVQARALRPTPVIDSGSMPLRERLGWIWWAGWGVFSMSTCVLAML